MRGTAAKALRSYSGFDTHAPRNYDVIKRIKEVSTPKGPVKVERFQVTISTGSSKRRAYQAMKKVFKSLNQIQKSKLGFSNLPLAV